MTRPSDHVRSGLYRLCRLSRSWVTNSLDFPELGFHRVQHNRPCLWLHPSRPASTQMNNAPDHAPTFPALRGESTEKVGSHRLGCVTARVCQNWVQLCHFLLPGSLKYGRKRFHSKGAMRERAIKEGPWYCQHMLVKHRIKVLPESSENKHSHRTRS